MRVEADLMDQLRENRDGSEEQDVFSQIVEPVQRLHASLRTDRAAVKARLDAIDADIRKCESVLKAAGVMEKKQYAPQKKKGAHSGFSTTAAGQVEGWINDHEGEFTAADVAPQVGMTRDRTSKILSYLRKEGRIRLVRKAPPAPGSKGRAAWYARWSGDEH